MQHRAPAVALLSGGPDSATAAAIRAEACDISFLHFDYGQAQEPNELASAETIARHFGKSVDVFKVPELTSFFGRASNGVLTGSSCPTLGHGEAYDELPYIFGWAYSIAVSYAIVQGIRRLIIGVKGSFPEQSVVTVYDQDESCVAKGVVRYSSTMIEKMKGMKSEELDFFFDRKGEVINRDYMVFLD